MRNMFKKDAARIRHAVWLCTVIVACAAPALADWESEIGYTQLQSELFLPATWSNFRVAQVEAVDGSGDYMPDATDPDFANTVLRNVSAVSSGVSSHATTVGEYLYGSPNMSGGIPTVDVYQSSNFINQVLWQGGGSTFVPLSLPDQIINCSLVGTLGGASADTEVVRRYDYLLNVSSALGVVATNNGSSSGVPNIFAASYNAIVVGVSSGDDGTGYTQVDGPLIAPEHRRPRRRNQLGYAHGLQRRGGPDGNRLPQLFADHRL